ncbi:ferrous iron transport protein A [Leptolyngbyaceae cyanobacterium CCMR0082]|uniref:Ferrous iron transport protein A n=2 Tax=Adonisia turfae TaxID=2950184 RepID=A0A6M0RZ08_9CYAN|nr:FeoA family protein [Adonisia turfae]MDV3349274.1 FeoA family protein [Leptothoe sp. LEGE 181152]NEZ59369.1 ferrous iron transport protein A [Adonisia turfae CCMR0081]NEZ61434.1 ferrous iron transport protein A [Adonisia turfae CCMR0082]
MKIITIKRIMVLSELQRGELAVVDQVSSGKNNQAFVHRLAGLGIIVDSSVRVLRKVGFGGPLHIRVGATTEVAIRRKEADQIVVRNVETCSHRT